MSRRGLAGAATLILSLTLAWTPAAQADTGPSADRSTRVSKSCKARLLNPRDVVPAKRFARCVVDAMHASSTARLRSTFDDGDWNKGPARFTRVTTETSATYRNGMALVIVGRDAWLRQPGKAWVKAKAGGSTDEQLAETVRVLWLATASLQAYRGYLGSSSTGWMPTGVERRINGVRAKEYLGTPRIGGYDFERYAVWVDAQDRPIRIDSTMSLLGQRSTARTDFSKWGKPVRIKPPALR